MEREKLLKRRDQVVDGKLRKYYRITPQGRGYLRVQKQRLMELVAEAFRPEELRALLARPASRARKGRQRT
jgi:DNA-binding PadR family transcriptional regulator